MHITPNNKKYIGITSKKYPKKRWACGKGYKNQIFNKAIQKYGWDNIQHEILFENLTWNEAKELEINTIKKYNTTNRKYGYNRSPGGDLNPPITQATRDLMSKNRTGIKAHNFGGYPNNKTKQKMSIAGKNKIFSINTREKMSKEKEKKVYQYDLNGILINIFESASLASKQTNTNIGNLCNCCRHIILKANNYFWSYFLIENSQLIKDILNKKFLLKPNNGRNNKEIEQYNLEGIYIKTFKSIKMASDETKILSQEISQACKNFNKITRKYRWKFVIKKEEDIYFFIEENKDYGKKVITLKQIESLKGISWDNKRKKWLVSPTINGKRKFLGRFNTFEDAEKIRDEFKRSIKNDLQIFN